MNRVEAANTEVLRPPAIGMARSSSGVVFNEVVMIAFAIAADATVTAPAVTITAAFSAIPLVGASGAVSTARY